MIDLIDRETGLPKVTARMLNHAFRRCFLLAPVYYDMWNRLNLGQDTMQTAGNDEWEVVAWVEEDGKEVWRELYGTDTLLGPGPNFIEGAILMSDQDPEVWGRVGGVKGEWLEVLAEELGSMTGKDKAFAGWYISRMLTAMVRLMIMQNLHIVMTGVEGSERGHYKGQKNRGRV